MISRNIRASLGNTAPIAFKVVRLENGVRSPVDITGCSISLKLFTPTGTALQKTDFDASVTISGPEGLFSWVPTPADALVLPKRGVMTWRLSLTFPSGDGRNLTGKFLHSIGGLVEVVDSGPAQVAEFLLPLARAGTRNVGTTAERPTLGADDRFAFYDTTLGAWVRWNGAKWEPVAAETPSDPNPDPGDLTLLFDNKLL